MEKEGDTVWGIENGAEKMLNVLDNSVLLYLHLVVYLFYP